MITNDWDEIARRLGEGSVVVIPTDTVYGIAARLFDREAIDEVFAAKQRPKTVALPVLVSDMDQVASLVGPLDERAKALCAQHWPGALTVIVPAPSPIARAVGATSDSVGVRIPNQDALRELCARVGPIVATSANRHGAPPCRNAIDADACFEGVADIVVLDGGTLGAVSSTVVDLTKTPPVIVREGATANAVRESLRRLGLSES